MIDFTILVNPFTNINYFYLILTFFFIFLALLVSAFRWWFILLIIQHPLNLKDCVIITFTTDAIIRSFSGLFGEAYRIMETSKKINTTYRY